MSEKVLEQIDEKEQQTIIEERLKSLLTKAKKKKNVLESQEITAFFADMDIQDDQMDKITDYLEQNGVEKYRSVRSRRCEHRRSGQDVP